MFRSKPEDEVAGLDIPEMGGVAYNWDEEFARGAWPMPRRGARQRWQADPPEVADNEGSWRARKRAWTIAEAAPPPLALGRLR